MAFTMVGVEYVVGRAAENGVQFPGQVDGVLYPGVHALPAHRRMHMSGVACEKDTPVTVLGDLALVAMEARQPADLAHPEVASHRPGEDIDDLGGGGGVGVGDLMRAVPH